MSDQRKIPVIVLGGTGYVAGELLRLIAAHPRLELKAVLSDSQPGEPVAKSFAHLAPVYPELKFSSLADDHAARRLAAAVGDPVGGAARRRREADRRSADRRRSEGRASRASSISPPTIATRRAGAYEAVYKHAHGAPERIAQFTCAVPEHLDTLTTPHVAHPGCFATAVLLASVPLLKLGLVEPRLFAAGITGSTGSGRTPGAGTHHPQRHSDLYAYNPLSHRHTPEITALAQAASQRRRRSSTSCRTPARSRAAFTSPCRRRAKRPIKTPELLDALREFYRGRPFVRVGAEMPHIKDVAGSNYAFLSGAANGDDDRRDVRHRQPGQGRRGRRACSGSTALFGFEETTGLTAPAAGWT